MEALIAALIARVAAIPSPLRISRLENDIALLIVNGAVALPLAPGRQRGRLPDGGFAIAFAPLLLQLRFGDAGAASYQKEGWERVVQGAPPRHLHQRRQAALAHQV